MIQHWILVGEEVRRVDLYEWAIWYEQAERIINKTDVGKWHISTVFLGIDHRFGDAGPPLLFETMVFPNEDYVARYSTYSDAVAGHAAIVKRYEKREKDNTHGQEK